MNTVTIKQSTIDNVYAALCAAERTLEGKFPWPVKSKFTQKEAREAALFSVREAMRRLQNHDAESKTLGQMTPAQRKAAIKSAVDRLQAELKANAPAIAKVLAEFDVKDNAVPMGPVFSMDMQELEQLVANGQFHHAMYCNHATPWEGLHIYRKADDSEGGFRGFKHHGVFYKGSPELKAAEEHVRASVGSYGQG